MLGTPQYKGTDFNHNLSEQSSTGPQVFIRDPVSTRMDDPVTSSVRLSLYLQACECSVASAGKDHRWPFGGTLDQFGESVSICNEYAIVGAPTAQARDYSGRPTSMARDVGATYIFKREWNGWIMQARFLADDGATNDNFGRAVSIADGYAMASAPSDDVPAKDSGSVYIFQPGI